MDRWKLVAMLGFAGLGTLAFLRLVCNEVVLRIRAMHLRVAAEEAEREKARTPVNAASDEIHEVTAA